MLIMLTPEIKTNLILKEIGIKRYSIRPSIDHSHKKSLHFYKKGHILALLDKPYENFVREQQDLLIAIFKSTKIDNGEEVFNTIRYSSNNDLSSEFEEMSDLKMIIIFGNISCDFDFKDEHIIAPKLSLLLANKDSKKELWLQIKQKLNI